MKIHDIISEAPGLGTAIKAGVNAFKAARTSAPAVATAVPKVVKGSTAIKSLDDVIKMTPEKLATVDKVELERWGKVADDAKDYKAMDKIAKVLGKDTRTTYQKIAPNLIGGKTIAPEVLAAQALKSSSLAGKSADVVKLAATLELTQETVKYWGRSSDLDKKLAAGEITQEEYNKQLQQLRGQFIVGVVAPWATMAILKYPAKLLKIVPGAMKMVGFPNAVEITSILAKRGAQLALLGWFGSDIGKKWLTDLVGESFIGALGDIPAMAGQVYDVIQSGADVATGNTPAGFTPSSSEVGGGSGKYIDPFKGTSREGGL